MREVKVTASVKNVFTRGKSSAGQLSVILTFNLVTRRINLLQSYNLSCPAGV